MIPSKLLNDLIASAIGAKAHYNMWWAQVNEALPHFEREMNEHSDFFLACRDAHYTAFFVHVARLFDHRHDSSSLFNYLKAIRNQTDPARMSVLDARYDSLLVRAKPLLTIRHKTIAHIDARLTEKDIFAPLNITWNEIRSIINDTAIFVTELAGASQPGEVGIPRDGRLSEATIRLIDALRSNKT